MKLSTSTALLCILSTASEGLRSSIMQRQNNKKIWSTQSIWKSSATINHDVQPSLTDLSEARIIEFGPKIISRPFQKLVLKYFNRDLLLIAKKSSEATKNNSSYALQAYDMLLQALFASDEDRLKLDLPLPNCMSFGAVLDALSTSGLSEAPFYAETLIAYMEQLSASGYDCSPNLICYNSALTCWARSSLPQAGSYADALLSRMEQSICPDRISYTTTIRAWANTASLHHHHIDKPAVSIVQRAEDLLSTMERMYFEEGKEEMKPDEYTYSTAVDAVGKSGEPGAAQRAEAILRRMEEFHRAGKTQVKPTHITYTSVIDAYAKQCYSSSSQVDAEAAESLLKQMEEEGDTIRPNKISYTAVIDAWGKCGEGKRAEAVLRRMQQKYEDGDETVRPNSITYAVVINAYAKSNGSPNKAQKAFNVLSRMHAMYHTTKDVSFQPNTVVYTSCLNACAFTTAIEERPLALELLLRTMNELETSTYCEPNNRSYATFLRGLSNLFPAGDEQRHTVASIAFDNCCQKGEVDCTVLENLRFASIKVYTQRLGNLSKIPIRMLLLDDLPPEWSRNVANPRFRRGAAALRPAKASGSTVNSQLSNVLVNDDDSTENALVEKELIL